MIFLLTESPSLLPNYLTELKSSMWQEYRDFLELYNINSKTKQILLQPENIQGKHEYFLFSEIMKLQSEIACNSGTPSLRNWTTNGNKISGDIKQTWYVIRIKHNWIKAAAYHLSSFSELIFRIFRINQNVSL